MGHTDEGYAFHLANKYHDNERAYKVLKRFELSSPQLRQNILKSLSQAGRHWLFIQDPKSSDARASFGYLLQQLTEDYDKKPENEKVKIQTASHSGFCGGLYILDQYNQVDLKTMKWVSSEDLDNCVISTPVCVHYGEFNTGKTSLLQLLSALHGIRNGKVHQMNESKVMLVLTKSSRCYIPIDDPPQVVINKIAEAIYNGAGDMKNYAGKSLEDQELRRLCIITCKEFILDKGIWSKLIMISAPQLSSQNSEAQAAVEDLKPKMNKFGSQCLLYHLSFCSVFDNWENTKLKYTVMAKSVVPLKMQRLSRTIRNFSMLLPFVEKMILNEGHKVTMEQVLSFGRDSFGRLLAVLEPQGLVPTDLGVQLQGAGLSHLPMELVRLVNFLKTQPQTKLYVRNLEKPVSGVGVKCIAVRSQALTRANVGDIKSSLARLNVAYTSKGNIKFLSELSDTPYYKAGVKAKDDEGWKKAPIGKYVSSTALVVDSSAGIMEVLSRIIEDQAKADGCFSNGQNYIQEIGKDVDEKFALGEKVRKANEEGGEEAQVISQEEEKLDPGQKQVQVEDVQEEVRVNVQKRQREKVQDEQTEEGEGDKTEKLQGEQTEDLIGEQTEEPQGEQIEEPQGEQTEETRDEQTEELEDEQTDQEEPKKEKVNVVKPVAKASVSGIGLMKKPSVRFTAPSSSLEDEFHQEDDDSPPVKQVRVEFCICSSKCLRRPYCRCKKRGAACTAACHIKNSKCLNK